MARGDHEWAVPVSAGLVGVALQQQMVEGQFGPASLLGLYASNALVVTVGAF